jgi:hypothetical protein
MAGSSPRRCGSSAVKVDSPASHPGRIRVNCRLRSSLLTTYAGKAAIPIPLTAACFRVDRSLTIRGVRVRVISLWRRCVLACGRSRHAGVVFALQTKRDGKCFRSCGVLGDPPCSRESVPATRIQGATAKVRLTSVEARTLTGSRPFSRLLASSLTVRIAILPQVESWRLVKLDIWLQQRSSVKRPRRLRLPRQHEPHLGFQSRQRHPDP